MRHRHHRHERHGFAGGEPHFGAGPGFGFGHGGGGRGPRRRRRGDVRVGLLMLLDEEPRNGYQLMQAIEDRSGGRWRPSPGAVYPSLAQLEDEGLIQATDRDGTKLFEITDTGREHLKERHQGTPPWEDAQENETIRELRTQMRQLAIAMTQVAQAGNEDQVRRASDVLSETRRSIYRILAEEEQGPDSA